ncbi:hypothetical protein N1851_003712 [Merluccius polli]|uniref:Integrase p58-like C-terminal domain-containing protein n=1 Tax=Merluccius polli TaxID=89951 RepID=A0AA47N9M1_MERPO|nr:hypothetical protein N1851_003712 [Merluccius polli]
MYKRQALDDDVDLSDSFLDSTATPSSGKLSTGEVGEVSFADVFAGRGSLVSEQGADPDMSLLFESAVSAQEIVSVSRGFFLRNGVLMREWTPSYALAGEDWGVVTQVVVPFKYRSDILSLAHDHQLAGHLGVNKTPSELVFAHSVRGPLKLLKEKWVGGSEPQNLLDFVCNFRYKLRRACELATENLSAAQERMKVWYDKKAESRNFVPGDKVLVLLPIPGSCLQAHFSGPYCVENKVGDFDYLIATLERSRKKRLCHINMLKPYQGRDTDPGSVSQNPAEFPAEVSDVVGKPGSACAVALCSAESAGVGIVEDDVEVPSKALVQGSWFILGAMIAHAPQVCSLTQPQSLISLTRAE